MCGITIFLSKIDENIIEELLQSLKIIQNRGYDSVGVSYISNQNYYIQKFATTETSDSLDDLTTYINKNNINGFAAIGHTRWATHGARNTINAHPHISMNNKIIIVHNGIITNYLSIKNNLIKNGYKFISETDSEVVANLIEFNLNKSNNIQNAIQNTISLLEGTWALGIIYTENLNEIFLTRHGSPLLIGESEHRIVCCSEVSGFCGLVNNYIMIENKDIVKISKNGIETDNIYNFNILKNQIIENSHEPYSHWTIKEIYEQPISINNTLNNGARIKNNDINLGGLRMLQFIKNDIENIIGLGCGTSYHATLFLKKYINKSCNKNLNIVESYDASEFSENDLPKKGKTLCIICSQSGETRDLITAIDICKKNNCITLGIVNVVDSLIAQTVDCGIYLNAGRENAVASTKSFTSMVIAISLFSMWLNEKSYNIPILNSLRKTGVSIQSFLENYKFKEECRGLVNFILERKIENIFLLGSNKMYIIAKEGALKIKEMTYIHAESYPAGSLKHGPFALLDNKNLTLLLVNKYSDKLFSTYNQIKSRNTNCYVLTNELNNSYENYILLPSLSYYNEIIFIVALQYIAFELSVFKNINPDKPRNLAKVVTVE
tara:strand:+ start:3408 stop:5231 length:1824 start_codon:yes stop_codon:yes gene_type:complete